ncbi:MAG: FixH family protein [Pseudomonadota bacterium]
MQTDHGRTRELTGRHVLIICLSAFGVIITANMALVFAATGSFPGTVVENSYRAGVGWNDRVAAQEALGWTVRADYDGEALAVAVIGPDGEPVRGIAVEALLGRPASAVDDKELVLAEADGLHVAPVALEPGSWLVDIRAGGAEGDETAYRAKASFYVPIPRGGDDS